MGLRELIGEKSPDSMLVRRDASALLHGAVRVESEQGGWCRPWRLSAEQMRALGSCQAWHPGLFRQMGRATSGICVEFTTDSSEVALEVKPDAEPTGTRAVLDYVDGRGEGRALPHDGLSCDVDGRHLAARLPREGDGYVVFDLDDPEAAPLGGIMQLPGMGETHHVRIWLPCLRGCAVRSVVGNGSTIEPVAQREQLLVLGDSIAQGFVCDDPALGWPSLLAQRLGLDLVNQGIGGQVFQPGSLFGLARSISPVRIVVELGANYRYEPCRERLVSRDIRSYLLELSRLWPEVPTYVLTPLWHDEAAYPSHRLSCYSSVGVFLSAHTAPHDQMTLVDGARLLDPKSTLMADGFEHPNPEGSAQIAERLYLCMCAHRGSDEGRRARALEILAGAPRRAVPALELARRGRGDIVLAQDGCVLMRDAGGMQLLWADDQKVGAAVVKALVEPGVVDVLEPSLVREVERAHGLTKVVPYHLALWEKNEAVAPSLFDLAPTAPAAPGPRAKASGKARVKFARDEGVRREIRPLDRSFATAIRDRYENSSYLSDADLSRMLDEGRFLGAFELRKGEGGEAAELVGFVGEHDVGSIGMLTVFPDHRRQGWGEALEVAKINQVLDRGDVPWCEVYPDHRASVRLQKKLGFKVTPSNEQCFLSASEPEPPRGSVPTFLMGTAPSGGSAR